MIKWVRIALLAPIVIFYGWYIPVAWVNVLSCDDYWHRMNVSSYGFFGAQAHYWMNWEGSYVHTFLATLPHLFSCAHIPFVLNIVVMVLVLLSVAKLAKELGRCGNGDSLLIALYLTSIFYTFTTGAAEIRFWICANVPYMIGVSGLMILVSLCNSVNHWNWRCVLMLLAAVISITGNKITFIAAAFFLVAMCSYLKKKVAHQTLLVLTLMLCLTFLNLFAPGNFCRLSENVAAADSSFDVVNVLIVRANTILSFCCCLVFVVPIMPLICKNVRYGYSNRAFEFVALVVIAYIVDTLILYCCFRDPGPLRTYVILEWIVLVCSIVIMTGWCRKMETCAVGRIVLPIVVVCAIVGLSWCQFQMLQEVPSTFKFARYSRLRDAQVRTATNDSKIDVIKLPGSHLLLSYFSNDKEWINNVYLPSFSKNLSCKNVIEVPDGF